MPATTTTSNEPLVRRAFTIAWRESLRTLARSPTWVFVAIFTLALAIGANSAIFSAVELVLDPLVDPALAPRGVIVFVALLGVVAGLALMLAALGLYAVMADSVIRRTHELASGAPSRAAVAVVVRQSRLLAGVGVVLGVLGEVGLARLVTAVASGGVGPGDPLTFVTVTLVLVVAGLAATYSPARRVTRRHE
ncbi:hypothetical protein [Nannocystis pusilla]|uniref:Uncharacterized protein n=1 Tax=Nannocystis pusilla TaxID=889268 RepID=A0ABS7TX46_9BACT|nr:hypothetical protein [Nannocystis pusilla]MBZ5712761.1 hypothetical protein [Nannocystis pusilla]